MLLLIELIVDLLICFDLLGRFMVVDWVGVRFYVSECGISVVWIIKVWIVWKFVVNVIKLWLGLGRLRYLVWGRFVVMRIMVMVLIVYRLIWLIFGFWYWVGDGCYIVWGICV